MENNIFMNAASNSQPREESGLNYDKFYNLDKFESYLKHKRYSDSTIKNYQVAVRQFLDYTGVPVDKISNSHLINYNNHLLVNGYSISFQNQVASGLKLFFSRILNREFEIEKIERPRREHKLPNVLSKEEITRVLRSPVNLKHRTMLSIIYACGLRRSELINLKPGDIDSARGLVIIRQGKGRKDRIVPLPEKILDSLRIYYRAYRPETWLFEGQYKNTQYSPTSLAKVLQRAVLKARILKPVSLHWLRHSYATHLLEQGTDIKVIQELLGHQSTKTTEIYTHVSTKNIQQIKSPFEDIDL
jgi:integrase/recombinase XerD